MASGTQTESPKLSEPPFLADAEALAQFCEALPQNEPCALDTEADSLHCHREKLCLIQFSCAGQHALIDPLAIDDLDPLHRYLEGAEIWMHGADYDMSIWKRTFDSVPERIFDTQTAARLLGFRSFGLAPLVAELFGVRLCKASQKADWGKRPLTGRMRSYAIDDVRYMLPMIEDFRRKLTAAGRWSWFVQMCAAARSQVLERTGKGADDIWRIAGWGKLDSRGLGFLRALWHWRDDQAHRWDKPPFKVLSNGVMLDFARRLSADESDEIRISSRFPPHVHQRFHEALAAAKAEPEDDLPIRNRRKRVLKSDDWEEVFGRLKDLRDRTAHELDIEASLIAPRNSLEQYAFNAEEREALRAELFLPWQQSFLFPETGASE